MNTPLIKRSQGLRRRHDERGVTLALVAIAMVSIIGVAMLAIDLVTLFLAREEAQRSADTAALAAARVISVSGITGTANTSTDPTYWQNVCGPSGIATQAALATASENSVSNTSADTVHVYYAVGTNVLSSTNTDCSTLTGQDAAINPMVVVTVQRKNLPTFFSRYFGFGGRSVTSTAVAEVFNPSGSENDGASGAVTPVQPRCVKPWIVPNLDPGNPNSLCGTPLNQPCRQFVNVAPPIQDGSIVNPGITLGGTGANGVIGESFWLVTDCAASSFPASCAPPDNPAKTNSTNSSLIGYSGAWPVNNLEYLPGAITSNPVAIPSCATTGTGTDPNYIGAVAGCDQSTAYQCGVPIASQNTPVNSVDLNENPGGVTGDTVAGLACSATQSSATSLPLNSANGLDSLDTTAYPFKMLTGTLNPLKIPSSTQVTASNQIVSLPIYDTNHGIFSVSGPNSQLTVVGFLQVFINQIDPNGNVQVTVLNVAGCGNGSNGLPNNPVTGSSPVPIRLITPP